MPDVVFPTVDRNHSGTRVLTMQYLDGVRPDGAEAIGLPEETRERLVDLGAASIIRMLYRDGFFHADLHPGNLLVLPGARSGSSTWAWWGGSRAICGGRCCTTTTRW